MLPRVLTALITPFKDTNNDIDMESLMNLIKLQLDNNCGIVLFGTTGECPVLTEIERDLILKNIKDTYSEKMNKFVIGVGGYNTIECEYNIKSAFEMGFKYFMLTCPYYNKPTQKGLEAHFDYLCQKFPQCEFIIYNIPSRTNVNLLPQTLHKIIEKNLNVIGIKEASGDLNQMILVKKLCPDLLLYSGDDTLLIPTLSIDGYGVISVISNSYPKHINRIIELWFNKKIKLSLEMYLEFDELIRLMFVETNPSPIKYLLALKNQIESDQVRLPLIKMCDETYKQKINSIDLTLEEELTKYYQ